MNGDRKLSRAPDPVTTSAKLLELREDVRLLLGEEFEEQMRMGKEIIGAQMLREGATSPFTAVMEVCRSPDVAGRETLKLFLLAAAVEMTDEGGRG